MHFRRFLLYLGVKNIASAAGRRAYIHLHQATRHRILWPQIPRETLGFSVLIREDPSACVFGLGGTKIRLGRCSCSSFRSSITGL
ncbi:hypothetical protein F5882DRAFT_398431 [Hyaloscypha sp. PMI_1271]|nr:hypothetical protein F5882DRAFT_398431 [Hyaloscypha sp. PMI_1271]